MKPLHRHPRPHKSTTVRAFWAAWLILACTAMAWMGCSDRRVRPGFCRDDCTEEWEPDCERLCAIPAPTSDDQPIMTGPPDRDASSEDPSEVIGDTGTTRPDNSDDLGDGGVTPQDGKCGPRCSDFLCDQERGECALCSNDEECSGRFPYCDEDGICVGCKTDAHCNESAPYCESTERSCVQCMNDQQCSDPEKSQCLDNFCVPCSAHEQCTEPEAPVCTGGMCTGCSANADCQRFGDERGVCEASSHQCVQCTDSDRSACCSPGSEPCLPTVCDNRDHTCSDRLPMSAEPCEQCLSDTQCRNNHVCVKQRFDVDPTANEQWTELEGHYCLPKVQVEADADNQDTCYDDYAPFIRREPAVQTISGETADICTLRQSTCPAFVGHEDRNDACQTMESTPNHSACGYEGLDDARCVLQETAGTTRIYLCKMVCLVDKDCKEDYRCAGSDGAKTCEPG